MQHRITFLTRLRRFHRNEQALALTEFALVLPILMTLFYGTIEVTRYVLITQKVEKLAHSVADMASQSTVASLTDLNQVMVASSDIMKPYTLTTNGKVIVTSLYRAVNVTNATVNWRHEGAGTLSAASLLGVLGATPIMPAGFTFSERENVIAAEVYYRFSPLISNQFFGTKTIYRVAFYKPRFGALLAAPI